MSFDAGYLGLTWSLVLYRGDSTSQTTRMDKWCWLYKVNKTMASLHSIACQNISNIGKSTGLHL